MPQIDEWDAKLWIKEISAEVFAFNDHLSCSMHVWGFGKNVKRLSAAGTSAEAGEKEEQGGKRPAFELNEPSIISTRGGTPRPWSF